MIFHRIVLNDLFSYKGEQVFDFGPGGEADGKLTLVIGRNGFGKTSLLNAVKLLFLGSDDKTQRQVGFPPSGLSRRAYILGNGTSWAGIMNRQAKLDGKTDCSVRVEIGPPNEISFVAERRWKIEEEDFAEFLSLEVEGSHFANDAAELRLDEFLPRELVPFFFFDGEEIQFLAEASDIHRAEAMERLLSLSYVNGVETELGVLAKEWRRETLPEEVQAEIIGEEGKIESLEKHVQALLKKKTDLESQLRESEDRSETLKHRMNILRSSGAFSGAKDLGDQIEKIERELQQEQSDLAYSIAADAPLFANPGLVQACLEPIRSQVNRQAKATESVLETLYKVLPERIFREAPQPREPLTEEQRRFLENKLKRILDAFGVQDDSEASLIEDLDLVRARNLLERFLGINGSMRVLREERARRLRQISRKKAELEERRAEWREAEFGSAETAGQYKQLEAEFADCQQQIGKINSEQEKIGSRLKERQEEQESLRRGIKDLERRAHRAEKASKRLEIAIGLRDSFKEYRAARRDTKRAMIEKSLNAHFGELMSGHDLIQNIEVNEDFHLRFLDRNGDEIGHSTISHGMRQLAVTALLWALKDVSGRALPIMVDTPLARIDRENQENLLLHYYPNAADQVIVLATDSEVDEWKRDLVRPHLAKILELANPDGEQTSISVVQSAGGDRPSREAASG